jgi:hypothetical protein
VRDFAGICAMRVEGVAPRAIMTRRWRRARLQQRVTRLSSNRKAFAVEEKRTGDGDAARSGNQSEDVCASGFRGKFSPQR